MKQKAMIEAALSKHGLAKTMTKAKRKRLLEAAEQEAEELAALQEARSKANETRLNPDDLLGKAVAWGVGGVRGRGVRVGGEGSWRRCKRKGPGRMRRGSTQTTCWVRRLGWIGRRLGGRKEGGQRRRVEERKLVVSGRARAKAVGWCMGGG